MTHNQRVKEAMNNADCHGESIPGREMLQGPQVGGNMELLLKKKAIVAEMEPVRVAGQQDDGREAADSLMDNKDLVTYSQCCSKPLKREFCAEKRCDLINTF